jgi:hypothetical protein
MINMTSLLDSIRGRTHDWKFESSNDGWEMESYESEAKWC